MANFKSILSGIGHFFVKVFTNPNTVKVAGGIVDIALPQFKTLTDQAVEAVVAVENAAIVSGQQSGTGAQKSALVIAAIEAQYNAFCAANNIPVIPGNIQKYVDAVVAMLNAFPMPSGAAAPVTTSTVVSN